MPQRVLDHCRSQFPAWAGLTLDDVELDAPKGFSSFTMGVKPRVAVDPPAVFYRRLAGKENPILDHDTEKRVFLALGDAGIAAPCLAYCDDYRIEAFYSGRSLRPDELFADETLRAIARQLHRLHQLRPTGLPQRSFFELLHEKWGRLARGVLGEKARFDAREQRMLEELRPLLAPETLDKVRRCLPTGELTFCHNDTYHGNIMRLADGEIRLLDFEFSCLGHRAYDFSNLFAETVMQHGQSDYPHFRIGEPSYTSEDLGRFIGHYLDCELPAGSGAREARHAELLSQTEGTLLLSHYVYAMAAFALALEPEQRLRFVPYAHTRFAEFELQYAQRFG